MFIFRPNQLSDFVARLRAVVRNGAPLALDTEFLGEKRYHSRLCLVQIHAADQNQIVEGALDPFTLDLRPVMELVGDSKIVKIVHSGSVDLQIIWQNFGIAPQNVFDTQIAAAFLGFGHQIGYADIARRISKVQISKTMQYTDWSARPLSDEQIEYALSDVQHLPPIYEYLQRELEKRGRLGWAQSEFARAQTRAVRGEDDKNAYKKMNLSNLNRKQLGVLREVATVRERLARAMDKPTSFLVPELALIQLARQQPENASQLRAIRGMPALSGEHARLLIESIEIALNLPPEMWPEAVETARPDPRLDSIVSLLGVVAGARATGSDVSRTYLAPRDQLWELATRWLKGELGDGEDLEILQDWRAELVGRDLLALLRGERAVSMDGKTGLPVLK